jgi:hypothetical protein
MRLLPAVILVVFLASLPSCKYFKGNGLFGRKASKAALLARQDSIRVADSLKSIQDQLLAIENEKLELARKADEERLSMEGKFRFNIIVGSFITPEFAQGLAEAYKRQGYDPKIIMMQGNKFQLVSAEGYDNFSSAFARLKEFQDTVELNAWIYIKE